MATESHSKRGPRRGVVVLVAGLVVAFAAIALVSALAAPLVHAGVEALAPGRFPFQRVTRRLVMLVALVALVVGVRAAGARSFADIGLGRWRAHRRAALVGVAWGALAIVAAFAGELALGRRAPSLAAVTPGVVAEAMGAGAVVGLLEEAACRGALYFPFAPMAGASLAAANVATSSLYATAHFLRGGGRPRAIDAWSGFRLWAELPGALADHAEAWVGLFLTGALLYALVARQGHAWGAVGVHAGAVFALQLLGTATAPVPGADAVFLVDGLLPGWGLSLVAGVGLIVVAARGRRDAEGARR